MTPLAEYLQPRVGRKMKASTVQKIDAAIAEGKRIKKRQRARRAVAAVIAETASASAGGETYAPEFDRRSYNDFLKSWRVELNALGETERLEIEAAALPYFTGSVMDKNWQKIVGYLKSVRESLKPIVPVSRNNGHSWGAPLSGGW